MDGALMKPVIIAIPQRSNRLLYGPWAEGYKFGATELEGDGNLTPENFGGLANMNVMGQSLAWHTATFGMGHEESGDVRFVGVPTTELGKTIIAGGPYVTDINVTIGHNDISTSYTMKTWTVNFGKLLKYNEERIQSIVKGIQQVKSDLSARLKPPEILDPTSLGWEGGMWPTIRPNRFGGPNAGTPHHWIVGESFQDVERENGQTSQISEFFSNVAVLSSKEVMAQVHRKNSLKAGVTLDGLFRPFCTSYDHMTQQELNINTGNADKDKYHIKHYDMPGFEDGSTGETPNVADLNPFTDDGAGHGHDIQGIIGGHEEYGTNQKDLNRRKAKKIVSGPNQSQENLDSHEYSQEYRSIGLRGPLVVVGWGYDVQGNPVPANPNDGSKFYDDHKKRQDLWKAGPVDLRWDDTRKVWVAGGGAGGAGDIWLSTSVNLVGNFGGIGAGVAGAAYAGLARGGMSSYCSGGCTHDAIAMFRASEDPNETTASGATVRKNRAIEVRLEEVTGFDVEGDALFTSGGWLGQPIPAGTLLFTVDTGRIFTDPTTQKKYPIHWVLQAQFTQVQLVSAITCSFNAQGESSLTVCTTDLWTEGPVTLQACPLQGVQCPQEILIMGCEGFNTCYGFNCGGGAVEQSAMGYDSAGGLHPKCQLPPSTMQFEVEGWVGTLAMVGSMSEIARAGFGCQHSNCTCVDPQCQCYGTDLAGNTNFMGHMTAENCHSRGYCLSPDMTVQGCCEDPVTGAKPTKNAGFGWDLNPEECDCRGGTWSTGCAMWTQDQLDSCDTCIASCPPYKIGSATSGFTYDKNPDGGPGECEGVGRTDPDGNHCCCAGDSPKCDFCPNHCVVWQGVTENTCGPPVLFGPEEDPGKGYGITYPWEVTLICNAHAKTAHGYKQGDFGSWELRVTAWYPQAENRLFTEPCKSWTFSNVHGNGDLDIGSMCQGGEFSITAELDLVEDEVATRCERGCPCFEQVSNVYDGEECDCSEAECLQGGPHGICSDGTSDPPDCDTTCLVPKPACPAVDLIWENMKTSIPPEPTGDGKHVQDWCHMENNELLGLWKYKEDECGVACALCDYHCADGCVCETEEGLVGPSSLCGILSGSNRNTEGHGCSKDPKLSFEGDPNKEGMCCNPGYFEDCVEATYYQCGCLSQETVDSGKTTINITAAATSPPLTDIGGTGSDGYTTVG